ncbi:MarR family winged helix-turn-helix transcriptional regulator [Glycomyces tenuis]|uniref:MarR family winged helix-turn-helix transcriptional regulator n=1 Tax=Glycomyces tenuis TaxID=58116 RepID=UPI00041322C7|nr:MarR family winged helix-turn-helix transcriptional regulator [Glycomyces tenuis]
MDAGEIFGQSTGFLLHRLGVGAERVIERTLSPFDLRAKELRVLGFIRGEGCSQRELVDATGLDRTTMVAVVDRLEALGLVERRRDPSDRRKQSVMRTERGARRLTEAAAALAAAETEFLSPLSESQRRTLNAVLAELFVHRRPEC